MLKLPFFLLVLLGTCTAQDMHSLAQLQGNACVLMVFAPDTNSPDFKRQLQLIERHAFELAIRNTVVVPVSTAENVDDHFAFENLPLFSAGETANVRNRFHVHAGDFEVLLINQNGTVQIRSASPLDIHELVASLDGQPLQH